MFLPVSPLYTPLLVHPFAVTPSVSDAAVVRVRCCCSPRSPVVSVSLSGTPVQSMLYVVPVSLHDPPPSSLQIRQSSFSHFLIVNGLFLCNEEREAQLNEELGTKSRRNDDNAQDASEHETQTQTSGVNDNTRAAKTLMR